MLKITILTIFPCYIPHSKKVKKRKKKIIENKHQRVFNQIKDFQEKKNKSVLQFYVTLSARRRVKMTVTFLLSSIRHPEPATQYFIKQTT